MSIRASIQERPDGWHYEWWEEVIGNEEAVIWSGLKMTFEGAVEALWQSVRERKPAGHLQNDSEVLEESTIFAAGGEK